MDGASITFAAFLALSFARSEAMAYARAGCTDLARIQELQQAGITPEHLQAYGRTVGGAYSDGSLSLAALRTLLCVA